MTNLSVESFGWSWDQTQHNLFRIGEQIVHGISATTQSYHNPDETENSPAPRDADYSRWRVEVAAALLAAGYAKESEAFASCADPAKIFTVDYNAGLPAGSLGVYVCEADPHHHAKAIAPMCKQRICPDCAHMHTARFLSRYVPVLLDLEYSSTNGHSLKHIVLTTPISLDDPDCKTKLQDLLKQIPLIFDTLGGKGWREDSGLLVAFEFGEDGRKLHFHCIWFGKYIPQYFLAETWKLINGGIADVVWIEKIDTDGEGGRTLESAVAEVAKYATKLAHKNPDGTWRWMPAADVVTLFGILKGVRRVRSYGLLYNIPEPEKPHICPVCAAPMLKLSVIEWDIYVETGWLPQEFQEAINPPLFKSILGNNFCGLPPPETTISTHIPTSLPGFEHLIHCAAWDDTVK